MTSANDIVASVGRANIREKLGVTDTAISNALARRVFPPKWYRLIKQECDLRGILCPMDLFSFVDVTSDTAQQKSAKERISS